MLDDDLNFDWLDESSWAGDDAPLETTYQPSSPLIHARRVAKREFVNGLKKEALNALLPSLPDPDTEVYILTNGSGGTYRLHDNPDVFEFGHFVPVLAERLGGHCDLYASTWTMNRAHGKELLQCLDDGRLRSVVLFTDPYWKRRESAVANEVISGLLARGQRYLCFKCHTKIVAMASADGERVVNVFSSCNFSSQPRTENITLNTDMSTFDWLKRDYFEAMLNHAKS
jgi:hypothetical protein